MGTSQVTLFSPIFTVCKPRLCMTLPISQVGTVPRLSGVEPRKACSQCSTSTGVERMTYVANKNESAKLRTTATENNSRHVLRSRSFFSQDMKHHFSRSLGRNKKSPQRTTTCQQKRRRIDGSKKGLSFYITCPQNNEGIHIVVRQELVFVSCSASLSSASTQW